MIRVTIGDWSLINRTIVPNRVAGRKGRPVRASRDRHQPFWTSSAPKGRALASRAPTLPRTRSQAIPRSGWSAEDDLPRGVSNAMITCKQSR